MSVEKICTKCNEVKPLSDYSAKFDGKYGYNSRCKVCELLRGKKYKEENKEKISRKNKIYNKKNKKKLVKARKVYYLKNREKELERSSKWKRENRESERVRINEWRKENPIKAKTSSKREAKEHVKNLTNSYMKKLLCRDLLLTYQEMPIGLLELKRTQIKLARELKKQAS